MREIRKVNLYIFTVMFLTIFANVNAQFVHPGIWHKRSDLDRMKYMVEAKTAPWYSSYLSLKSEAHASYNYVVRKDPEDNTLSRENPSHQRYQYESDAIAAYHNALMWYITGDSRHAEKAIEILNAWADLTSFYGGGTEPLCAGLYGAPLINAAEIIKNTYDGWSEAEIKKFGDMLVYPGYSNTSVPTTDIANDNVTFYWRTYMGDPGRHGNQGLLAWRTVMAIGIFLDNEIIYDRALNNILGLPHREDDLPYPSGPPNTDFTPLSSSNEYYEEYKVNGRLNTIADYGFDDQIQHYIYENGQCQEASRDQSHTSLGVGTIAEMMEIVWNQGQDIYSYLNDRVLSGLEYSVRYNMSEFMSFPDQSEPWEPTVESGEFLQKTARCGRWKSLKINPWVANNLERDSRGENIILRPIYEMSVAHFTIREGKSEEAKWIVRARDYAEAVNGNEGGTGTDVPGWGGLTYRRPDGCAGDPVNGFSNEIPGFAMHVVPGTIEAANYDFFSGDAEGRTYHDSDDMNSGGYYRSDAVDIDTCSLGGYCVTDIKNGEWLTYTIAAPATGLYNISMTYAAAQSGAKLIFSVAGNTISSELEVPFGGENSTAIDDWKDYTIATDVILQKGVQALNVYFNGGDNALALKSFDISSGSDNTCSGGMPDVMPPSFIEPGLNFNYYTGSWDALPDFSDLTPDLSGITDSIGFVEGTANDNFALVFTGYIQMPIDGTYTFYATSDEGSRVYIDENLVVENDGLHASTEASGSICLDEGFHAIRVEYFEKTGDELLELSFEGPGISKRSLENIYAIGTCEHEAITLPDEAIDGVSYYVFDGEWTKLPDFVNMSEMERGVTSSINTNVTLRSDYFGLVFKGYLDVPEDADYTFFTTSDDGSRLSVDGIRVVSNDGTHGAIEASGNICLSAGYHLIVVEYFDNSGGHSLKAEYEGGGVSRRLLTGLKTLPVQDKLTQIITFPAIPTKYLGQDDFDPGATSSAGLPVSYSSYDESIVSIVNGKVHIVGAGTTAIIATQEGNVDYRPAQKAAWVSISPKLNQTIDFADIPTKYLGDADFDPGAVASSGLPVSYLSTDVNVATIVEDKVHIVGAGQTAIFAKQAGNYMYNAAQAAKWLSVEKPTHIHAIKDAGIRVYPNPSENMLMIELDELQNARVEVVDFVGKSMFFYPLNSKSNSLDMSILPKGVYVLRIITDQKMYTQKIIKK